MICKGMAIHRACSLLRHPELMSITHGDQRLFRAKGLCTLCGCHVRASRLCNRQSSRSFSAETAKVERCSKPAQSRAAQLHSPLRLGRRQLKNWSLLAASENMPASVTGWQSIVQRILRAMATFAAVALLILAALPSLLSTSMGSNFGCALASRYLPGAITVDDADLGWNKKVKLSNLALTSPKILGKEKLASAQKLATSASLWSIVRGKPFDVFAEKAWIDNSLSPSGQFKWGQLLDYKAGKVAGASKLHASVEQPDLVAETEEIAFTAEGRFLTGTLYGSGSMKIPREVIGKDLHLAAVVGASNLKDSMDDLGLDISWLDDSTDGQASQQEAARGISQEGQSGQRVKLPGEAGLRRQGEPTILSVRSQHMDIEASGWRLANGDMVLRKPATAVLDFTPALAEYGLGRLSPLLSGVLAVEEGKVIVTLTPELSTLPAATYHVRVEPLRIAINRQDLLARAIEFMRLKEGKEISQKALLQGMTSAIHVDIAKDGSVDTHRVDLLVSADRGKTGLHLCTWGSVNPVGNEVDVSLGIPSSALAMIGLKCGKEADMLVIPVSGKTSRLKVNWTEAYKRLASLAAQQPGKTESLRGKLLHGVVQALDMRANAPGLAPEWEAPQPLEPLPWHEAANLLKDTVEVDEGTVKGTSPP